MVYNGYYKVMSNIPKMGHLMTHENILGSDAVPLDDLLHLEAKLSAHA